MILEEWWRVSSHRVMGQIRSGFNTLVILGSWVLWNHRNNCVFGGSQPSLVGALQGVVLALVSGRASIAVGVWVALF
jgi:hypothetical protein